MRCTPRCAPDGPASAWNAAEVYGFDLEALDPLGALHGPDISDVARPLDMVPVGATSPAFVAGTPPRAR